MKKIKYALALILTAAVIAVGALLPFITAKVQDYATQNKFLYDDMEEMHLNLYELSTLSKIYLLHHGSIVGISEEKTRLKTEDIQQVVETQLQPYITKGFLEDHLSEYTMELIPQLYYVVDTVDISNVFWLVSMFYETANQSKRIELCIDDKTGLIMTISYDCLQPVYEDWLQNELLVDFYTIYFNRLDLKPQEGFHEQPEKKNGIVENVATFLWGDLEYGEISMKFLVYSNGFHNWIFDADMM